MKDIYDIGTSSKSNMGIFTSSMSVHYSLLTANTGTKEANNAMGVWNV
jgi:hypothetical protein